VRAAPGEFFDPFHEGEALDEAGCRARFTETQGQMPFRAEYLEPVRSRAILARMLANLVRSYVERSPADAVWALRLRLRLPGVSIAERRHAATLLANLGRFEEAATALEELAPHLESVDGTEVLRDARRLRARAN
jgi:regulator of sirC expression with transglutaminase-like and TPR domain